MFRNTMFVLIITLFCSVLYGRYFRVFVIYPDGKMGKAGITKAKGLTDLKVQSKDWKCEVSVIHRIL